MIDLKQYLHALRARLDITRAWLETIKKKYGLVDNTNQGSQL